MFHVKQGPNLRSCGTGPRSEESKPHSNLWRPVEDGGGLACMPKGRPPCGGHRRAAVVSLCVRKDRLHYESLQAAGPEPHVVVGDGAYLRGCSPRRSCFDQFGAGDARRSLWIRGSLPSDLRANAPSPYWTLTTTNPAQRRSVARPTSLNFHRPATAQARFKTWPEPR